MLETNVLWLRPVVAGQPRVIADAATGTPAGFARLQPDKERGWVGTLLGPLLAVHEQEEEPLLFTVRRCFLWTQREVRDAEDERVGYVSPGAIRDRDRLLYAETRLDSEGVAYQCVNGVKLASARRTPGGLELSFMKEVQANPFVKMLLLAAALFQE